MSSVLPPALLVSLVQVLISLIQVNGNQQCQPAKYSEYGYALRSSAYKTLANENLGMCYTKCFDDKQCGSINYNLSNGECEHNHVTKKGFPSRLVRSDWSVYAETKDPDYGSSRGLAVSSCKKILELHPKASSGTYWISPKNGSAQVPPYQVYCDMTTDGGGWTLVYSYRFTNFANFGENSNALTPIPSWTINLSYGGWSQQSVTVPLSETSYSAMDFALWKRIGTEFLVKPNITHWISCKPGTGELVNWKAGPGVSTARL
ncbi:hypothetical protein QZH41_001938 [Actinostola sp. cb2023]|nr:hypothetical protein QZH41_001938 [Actinostola sp. cb2023]